MLNCRRIVTLMSTLALAWSAGLARAADQRVVSLTCREMEVQKAIRILQAVSDLRVVVDPQVPHKRITLTLQDLPAEDALKTVVAAAGLSYQKLGNAYLVEPKDGGTLSVDRARAALAAAGGGASSTQPSPGGGIVHPDAPVPGNSAAAAGEQRLAPVHVAPEVLAALERTVDVDVKNGPLTEVMAQLSHSAGIKVTAAPSLSDGLVATVGLHGIPLKSALEAVAGETGLQISPRPDGVEFVAPGLSLDAAQVRARQAPAGARHVDQGQLWTAEWANVLTSGFSAFDGSAVPHSLRRQSLHPDGRPFEFKPRAGGPRRLPMLPTMVHPKSPKAPPRPQPAKTGSTGTQRSASAGAAVARVCPHCGRPVSARMVWKCARCGRVLGSPARKCPACGGQAVRVPILPLRCPSCGKLLASRSS